ncbi:MAG TPA: hypothetical protein VE988_15190, partial [Gemmataceae bacterium]|nr:hypothetical protein [Gemmataceae bacterium]
MPDERRGSSPPGQARRLVKLLSAYGVDPRGRQGKSRIPSNERVALLEKSGGFGRRNRTEKRSIGQSFLPGRARKCSTRAIRQLSTPADKELAAWMLIGRSIGLATR